ncbi:MAG: sigma-70 family RNA polymerase sigma factor [Eubacteriales bacterium]
MQSGDMLITEFSENYMEKIFYFCLKKTGNSCEAEDLSSDIALCVFSELRRGVIPANFAAWVWRIARNRYSKWADGKRRRADVVSGADIDELELADGADIENEYVRREDLSLLRRELAFISSDYRDIVVAYYIDDRSVSDIASLLSLPKGTVTSKLFRARNILKEGMSMAREFGVRSYKPEQITFVNNCSSFGDNGQPWTILTHSMYKNIFLEVYNNPETAEEISLALGIALPYMEDELRFLAEQTFLVKEGDKYKTSFPIISAEAQRLVYEKNVAVTPEVTALLEKLIDTFSAACRDNGDEYYGGYQSYEDAKWTLLMRTFDWLLDDSDGSVGKNRERTVRPDNGRWDIIGYQDAGLSEPDWVGQHGVMGGREDIPPVDFSQFKYKYKNIEALTPTHISKNEAFTLKMAADGKGEECEPLYLDHLRKYGYINGFKPAIVVFSGYGTDKYWVKFSETQKSEITALVRKIKSILSDIVSSSTKLFTKDIPDYVGIGKKYPIFYLYERGYVLEQALRDGWLRYDDSTSKVIGAYLNI